MEDDLLHDVIVIDDYSPISCPPGKGLLLPLRFYDSARVTTSEGGSQVTRRGVSSCNDSGDDMGSTRSICLVQSLLPSEVLQDLVGSGRGRTEEQQLERAATIAFAEKEEESRESDAVSLPANSSGIRDEAVKAIKRRKQWTNMFSRKRGEGGAVAQGNAPEAADDGEVDHVASFLAAIAAQKDKNKAEVPSSVRKWLEATIRLVKEIDKTPEGSTALVIYAVIDPNSFNKFNLTSDVMTRLTQELDLASFIPQELRLDLSMTAVIHIDKQSAWDGLVNACKAGAIRGAAITPIPLRPGDHVYREVMEKAPLKFIKHHGIYVGNGRIIHFSGNEMSIKGLITSSATIRSTSFIRFMKHGSRLKLRVYRQHPVDTPDVVIHRAEEALRNQKFPEYDLFRNNCEHFCTWCKTGSQRSRQVEKAAAYTTAAAGAAVTLATAAALIWSMRGQEHLVS